jgi:dihydrofolate reductase
MDLIVAADRNCAIGKKGDLLYSLPEDMKYFRAKTLGKTVVMGQKTLESFPGGKPLPKRINVVLSSNPDYAPEDTVSVHNYAELFTEVAKYPEDDVMLIGGGRLYTDLAKYCRRAYITLIDAETEGVDTFIPNFDNLDGWRLEEVSEPLETGGYTIRFATYLNEKTEVYGK